MAVRVQGEAYKVLESENKAGGGQMGGVVKAKLRNLSSGRLWETHFRPDERLEDLQLEKQAMEFLYSDSDNAFLMNPNNYEQVEVPLALLGTAEKFLTPGLTLPVEFFDGRAVSVVFPPSVEARVGDTAPPLHSAEDNAWKEATLENGMKLKVPLFVGPGETVRVDLKTGKYVERVREKKKSA
jgi:elongation factor P